MSNAAAAAASISAASSFVARLYSPLRSMMRGTMVPARVKAAPTLSSPVALAVDRIASIRRDWSEDTAVEVADADAEEAIENMGAGAAGEIEAEEERVAPGNNIAGLVATG